MKNLQLLMFFLIISGGTLISQINHYVSVDGDDSNAGTPNSPWSSIQYAMDVAEPGSTVNIMGGTYNEKVYVNVSGTAGNLITFRNYNNETVIIDGTGWNDPAMCEIYDRQYVRLEGLHFTNNVLQDAMGIYIEGMCDHIEIVNCKISEIHFSSDPNAPVNETTNAQPLIVYGSEPGYPISNLLVQECEIFDSRTGYSEALAVNGNVDGFEISGNNVHDIANIGIDAIGHEGTCSDPAVDQARNGLISDNTVYNCLSDYASAAGIYVDGGKNIVIERNKVHNCQWGIEVGCENPGKTTSAITVRNNFIYSNSSAGIQLGGYDYPAGSGMVANCKVINNTLFNNATVNDYDGELTLTYSENCTIVNNIFYATNPEDQLISLEDVVSIPPGLVLDFNLWYHPDGADNTYIYWNGTDYESINAFITETGFEANAQFTDPMLKSDSSDNPDLHIKESSPAIGAANATYLADAGEKDIDGENRVDMGLDKGADEYYPSSGIFNRSEVNKLNVYPNPASDEFRFDLPKKYNQPVQVFLFDVSGRVVLKRKVVAGTAIDISNLSQGIYSVAVMVENKRHITELLVR